MSRKDGREPGGTGAVLGARLMRYSGVQGASLLLSSLIQLVSLAVVANFLGPSELGRYALLLFLAGLVTQVLNIAAKPGTIRRVFGAGDDEDDDDEDDRDVSASPQRSLGVGLLWAFALGLAGAGAVIAAAAPLADLLLGDRSDSDLILWAGATVAFWVPFKLATITIWLERRPATFVVADAARPLVGLIALIVLLAAGAGVEGAIAGTAIGTAAGALVALALLRASLTPAIDLRETWQIVKLGRHRAPIVMSFWTIQNADIFLLSRVVSETELGIYTLASRLGFVVSFLPQGFRVAMRPLRKAAVFQAVRDEYGQRTQQGQLLGYFVLLCLFSVLVMVLLGDVVVQIAPDEYSDAAALVPFTAAAMVMPALYRTVNQNVTLAYKRELFIAGCLGATAVFIAVTVLLAPEIGTYAAPVGMLAGLGLPSALMFGRCQLGNRRIGFPTREVATGGALAVAIAALFSALPQQAVAVQLVLALVLLSAYLALLVVLRVIPRNHWAALFHMARSSVRGSSVTGFNPRAGLRALPEPERRALRRAVRRRVPAEKLRDGKGEPLMESLRRVGTEAGVPGVAEPGDDEAEMAVFLFEPAPTAVRNASMRRLLAAGTGSNELRALEDLVAHLVRVPNEAWQDDQARASRGGGEEP